MTKEKTAKLNFTRNFFKVFALFSAVSLWFYVLNSEPLEMVKEVPLSLMTPPGLAVANIVDQKIKIKIRGSRAFMQNLFQKDEKVYIDLRDPLYKDKKSFDVHLSASNIQVPFGVEVLEVNPHQLTVTLDREISKEVPIRLQMVGDLGQDLRLIRQEVEPSKVMITGPIEVLRGLTQLRTTAVQMNLLDGDGELRLTLQDLDPRVKLSHEGPLVFRYSLKAQNANLTLKNIKIRFLASRQDFSTRQRDVSIDVLAPEGRLIRESEVQVIADIPEEGRGNLAVKLRAMLPEGVHLLQIHPETINVRVR